MSGPSYSNTDAAIFVTLGGIGGAVVGAVIAAVLAGQAGHRAGTAHGQCLEACLPDALVQTLDDNTCRCDHDRLVRPRSKPAPEGR